MEGKIKEIRILTKNFEPAERDGKKVRSDKFECYENQLLCECAEQVVFPFWEVVGVEIRFVEEDVPSLVFGGEEASTAFVATKKAD